MFWNEVLYFLLLPATDITCNRYFCIIICKGVPCSSFYKTASTEVPLIINKHWNANFLWFQKTARYLFHFPAKFEYLMQRTVFRTGKEAYFSLKCAWIKKNYEPGATYENSRPILINFFRFNMWLLCSEHVPLHFVRSVAVITEMGKIYFKGSCISSKIIWTAFL